MSKYCHLSNRYGLGPYDTFLVLFLVVESNKLHVNISNSMAGMNFCSIKLLLTIGFISVYLIKLNIHKSLTNSQIIKTIPVLERKFSEIFNYVSRNELTAIKIPKKAAESKIYLNDLEI